MRLLGNFPDEKSQLAPKNVFFTAELDCCHLVSLSQRRTPRTTRDAHEL